MPNIHEVTECKEQDCGGKVELHRYCGARVCDRCGVHEGLARCFCGWSLSGRDGRTELEEFGETIEPEEDW